MDGTDRIADIAGPGLAVLYCGINPGTLSGQLGQHFARPGNRFWKLLHHSGFTPELFTPSRQGELLDHGLGITNLVDRTSRAAADLTPAELRDGAAALTAKVSRLGPRWLAVLGVQAYRTAFGRPKAQIGAQDETLGDGTGIWLLPNPSGLQARYQMDEMVEMWRRLRDAAGHPTGRPAAREPDPGG